MDYDAVLLQVLDLLQRETRVSYRVLKRRFGLTDDDLEDLKEDLIYAKQLAVDEEGRVLVRVGASEAMPPPASPAGRALDQAPLIYTPPHLTEKILASRTALEGERKQVTILFADLKDSTELIRDLDPEAAQQLLDPALRHMMDAVHRYEGTVNQVLGDGIMALFGAPIAREDHAIRACYAALAMQAAMREYTEEVRRAHGLEMRLRVGLNSGEVVVRAIGNDLHMDYSAVGQTTHLAARMEQLASPGSIRLSATTLRLAEGLVRVNALGPVPVKGLAEPIEVFELVGASAIHGRLQAAVARGLTRFVGREREIETLSQALERAGAGHGQVVAAVGEAGVGKSRLVYEFVHSHRTKAWRVLEAASVSYGKATPYFPVIDLLKRYMHIDERDEARTIRAKVTGQLLTLDDSLQEAIPPFLSLLDVLPEDSPFQKLDPPQRRQRTLDALKRVLLRESQVQPLVLMFEDLHWTDSETQALLDSLIDSLPTTRTLLLINYRPEYQHGWGSKTYYTQLRLDPLPPVSAEELLQALLGSDPNFEPLQQLLIARTEGNPFFLEESVRTLMETEMLVGQPGAHRLVKPLDSLQVPATVQAVLAARVDRLPAEEKRLLQTAAAIGTEVPFSILQAIAELPEVVLHHGLAHLQTAEFLYETHLFPERGYTFKHALTHEVAYGSLLHERRRVLHARIVEAIETLAGERMAEQVERLAYHALRGEVWDKAVTYWRQAGQKALARSAHREAITAFEHALGALAHLPTGPATTAAAIDLRFDLRQALNPLGDLRRMLDALDQAESLAERLGDPHRLAQAAAYISQYAWMVADHPRAIASGQRALAMARRCGDVTVEVMAHYFLGAAYHAAGAYPQGTHHLEQNVAWLAGERAQERFGLAGLASVFSRTFLVWSLAEMGEFSPGLALGTEGVRLAEAVEHPYSLLHAQFGLGLLMLRQGDLAGAISWLERGVRLGQGAEIPLLFPRVASALGVAYALSGRLAEAVPLLEQAVDQGEAIRVSVYQALWVVGLGEGYLRTGRLEDAYDRAQQALTLARAYQERGHEAYALHLRGAVAVHHEPPAVAEAEAYYQQALALAEELGMRPLVAHCHHGLGALYGKVGQRQQARAELSAAIELYSAMEMSFWLPQAEAVLARTEYKERPPDLEKS